MEGKAPLGGTYLTQGRILHQLLDRGERDRGGTPRMDTLIQGKNFVPLLLLGVTQSGLFV